ncbi:hypothetical protein SLA2020_241830 [Shorea laevis]
MAFHFVSIFALLCLGVVGSCHASMPAELYWKSVFPNTPMPKSLQELLRPVNKSNFVKVKDDIDIDDNQRHYGYGRRRDSNPPRRLVNLSGFTKTKNQATFLSRIVADSMPLQSKKFSDILKFFSMETKSVGAKAIKHTIENCEKATIKGEDKYCATSLESLVDLTVLRFGKKIKVMSNEVEKETETGELTIGKGVKNMGENNIVCHKMKYPYAVFLCHSIDKTDVYRVPLVGSDGTKVKATAVCHKDTSAWSPRYLAFQVLKVKPGSVPICHFLARETIVWIPN